MTAPEMENMGQNAATLALLAQLTTQVAELKQQNIQVIAVQHKQGDMLVRIDERQTGWATKMELSEAQSTWQLALQPVAAKAEAAHGRLDEHRRDLDAIEPQLVAMRLNWARLGGMAAAASVGGAGIATLLQAVLK